MKGGMHISQRAMQTMSVTPQMIQTLTIMQYSTPELLEFIQHELADNPFLKEVTTPESRLDTINSDKNDEKNQYLEYVDFSDREIFQTQSVKSKENSDKGSIIEKTAASIEHLSDLLLDQLHFIFSEDSIEYKIGEYIIGSLNKDGYLIEKEKIEIIQQLNVTEKEFNEVHLLIKDFEPEGIASCNLQECLIKQTENFSGHDDGLEKIILDKYFDFLEKKKYKEIAKEINESLEHVMLAVHHISLLEPKPARKYQPVENTTIIPDVAVYKTDEKLELMINDDVLYNVEFNDEYKKLLKIKDNPELREYLADKEDKAKVLLSSIKYRKSNLQKVMEKIIVVQEDFFEKGPKFLKPYTRVKLAEDIQINQGTLSRIVNSKYIQTEWGTFSLRIFFSSSLPGKEGLVSSNQTKEIIKEIIESYDSNVRLSDQKISEALAKKGYKVARRTISKYRKELQILSSFHR